MKIKYKYKIVLSFVVLLAAVTLLYSLLLFNKASRLKIDRMIVYLQPYADIIHHHTSKTANYKQIKESLDSLGNIFPQKMRITLLDTAGWVIYDNFSHIDSITDNHSGRPEILESLKNGTGHSLRYSSTLDTEYLYFSKKYQDGFVRTALDYKQSVYPSLKGNRNWQAYIAIVFALSIVILVYITRKLSQPYYSLKQFVERVRHNEEHYDDIRFPKDELGEVGEQIMTAFREMDNAKKYKQQLTHNIAHELKTPVTGIRGYLETLLQEDNIDKEQARFFLERAYSQSLRLSAIVNDISVLNKIEEGPDQFEFETINISKCLQEIRNDLSFKLEEKNISFFMQIDPNLAIQGNYLLIYSLFKNLIDNSIDHAGENIEIHMEQSGVTGHQVYLTYYDTGKGVPDHHIHRIFERFYRVEKGRSRKSGGSGLGLSIVRNAVILHKGKISVSNRSSGGLQFDFTLSLSK